MRVSYTEGYFVSLPPNHPFPMGKFPVLRRILLNEGLVTLADIIPAEQASWADLQLVHTPEYLRKLEHGTFDAKEIRKLGLPWSEALVFRSRVAAQGTINAAHFALEDGIAANLGGGTHHAYPDHGEGFCVLNDVAIAIRRLKQDGLIKRALVVDLDVHQGNGTAAIFAGDGDVYTFSMHGARNYPFNKECSSQDVGLEDGVDDEGYMALLHEHLTAAFDAARADIVFYLAGVDPATGDRFGRLRLTREGLHRRDRTVLTEACRRAIPTTLVLSGGYAATPELTADLHAIAHREAARIW